MALVQRLSALQDRLMPIAAKFGLPQYLNEALETDQPNLVIQHNGTDYPIEPNPKITELQRNQAERWLGAEAVELRRDIYFVEYLSRVNYPEDALAKGTYLIGGVRYDVLYLDRNRTTDYRAVIARSTKR